MFGKLEGGRAEVLEVLEVKGESEMSKERGGADGGMCGGAGREERRGEGSGMDDSLVKWMTDVTCCSSSCQLNRRQRRRRRRKRRDIGQNVRPKAGDR